MKPIILSAILITVFTAGCIPGYRTGTARQDASKLDSAEFALKMDEDTRTLQLIDERTDSIQCYLTSLFSSMSLQDNLPLTPDQRTAVRTAWAAYLNSAQVLQHIILDHRRYYKLKGDARIDSYLTGYAAYLYLYTGGLFIVEHTMNRTHFEILLDESAAEYGIPPGQYARLKRSIIDFGKITNLADKQEKYEALCRKYRRKIWAGPRQQLAERIEYKYGYCRKKLRVKAALYIAQNTLDIIKDRTYDLIFPVQRKLAKMIGYTRLTSRKGGLISANQCERLHLAARPGDVLFERKEWYLTNMGLPGFWSHTAIYLGSAAELKQWAAVTSITDHYTEKDPACTGLPDYLARHYPKAWQTFITTRDDEPFRIIEGLGNGIIFTTLTGSPGISDHLACLRPRLSALDKAQAIEKAFSFWGRDYDFGFNFHTDEAIVCTELIYKSYKSAIGKAGLDLPLIKIMGTLTLPANRIIALFDAQYESTSQFDFVLYFASDTEETAAYEQDVVALRRSHHKPSWR